MKIRELHERATKGPWRWHTGWDETGNKKLPPGNGNEGLFGPSGENIIVGGWCNNDTADAVCSNESDKQLITELRNACPALIELVEAMRVTNAMFRSCMLIVKDEARAIGMAQVKANEKVLANLPASFKGE